MSKESRLITGVTAKMPDEQPKPVARHWSSYARGVRKERGVMNKTEAEFLGEVIKPRIAAGEVREWWYEPSAWRLTDKTPDGKPGIRYTPDFMVLLAGCYKVEFYEIKGTGMATRADLNRVKLAAEKYPFRFFVATKQTKKRGGGFTIEEY